jgi:uncharacterized protein YacL
VAKKNRERFFWAIILFIFSSYFYLKISQKHHENLSNLPNNPKRQKKKHLKNQNKPNKKTKKNENKPNKKTLN